MMVSSATPDQPPDGPHRSLEERCLALALRLCPMPAAHLVVTAPGAEPRLWSRTTVSAPPALTRPPQWDALLGTAPQVLIADTAADERVANAPQPIAPGIRSLVRLRVAQGDGPTVITLWLLDSSPRTVTEAERAGLGDLAHLMATALEAHAPPSVPKDAYATPRATIARLHAVLRNATDLVAINDAQGVVRYISPSVTRILGYKPADLIGKSSFAFLHPDDLAEIAGSFRAAAGAPGVNPVVRMRFRNAQGEWRTLEASSTNLLDDPHVRGVVVNARDVTERVRAEQAHEASEARFRAVFQTAPVGIIAVDVHGRIALVNPALARLFGYEEPELAVQPLELLLPEAAGRERGRRRAPYHAAPGRTEGELQLVGRHRTGAPIPVEVSLGTVELPDQQLTVAFVIDIRARQQAEAALRESEERYRRLVELAPDAVLVIQRGSIAFTNRTGLSLLGASRPEEVVSHSFASFLQDTRRGAVRALLTGGPGGSSQGTHQIQALDGQLRPVEVIATAIQYGGAPATLLFARDVTQRRRREQQIRFQASVLAQMSDAVVAIDDQFHVTYLNPAAERLYGRSLEAARGVPLEAIFTVAYYRPEDEQEAQRAMQASGVWRGECRHIIGGSRSLGVEVAVVALRGDDAGGGMVVVIRDVTARKEAEERLQLLESVVVHAHDAVIITEATAIDEPGPSIRYVNAAFTQITGYAPEEVIGRTPRLLQGPETDPQTRAQIRSALAARGPVRVEILNYTKDGHPFWADLSIAPVRDERGEATHFIAIQRDITQRKELEAQLIQAQKMESIGRLAGGVAHDFNNLLMVILGYVDLAEHGLAPGSPVLADLAQIRTAGERAADLTRQLLAFARKQVMMPTALDLNARVRSTVSLLRRLIGENIALELALDPELAIVQADAGQLDHVLINLAINARDAMPGGGTLRITTSNETVDAAWAGQHTGLATGAYVALRVRDTGVGIGAEALGHIFEPFYTTKESGKGTGLGLAMCYGIVKQHGGYIAAASEPGQGAEFTVYLPRADVQRVAEQPPEEEARVPGGAETILLVEDEEAVRALAAHTLRARGYRVVAAGSAEEALRLADQQPAVDLLLTDVVLPGGSGIGLAERLTARLPRLAVVFISGYLDPERYDVAGVITRERLLQKPFSAAALAAAVRLALDERQPHG
jgi:two-component system, cell cycle sensor histidine kinase and response regulator CckA